MKNKKNTYLNWYLNGHILIPSKLVFKERKTLPGQLKAGPNLTGEQFQAYKERASSLIFTHVYFKRLQELDKERASLLRKSFNSNFKDYLQEEWQKLLKNRKLNTLVKKKRALRTINRKIAEHYIKAARAHAEVIKRERIRVLDNFFEKPSKEHKANLMMATQNAYIEYYSSLVGGSDSWDKFFKTKKKKYIDIAEYAAKLYLPDLKNKLLVDKSAYISYKDGSLKLFDSHKEVQAYYERIKESVLHYIFSYSFQANYGERLHEWPPDPERWQATLQIPYPAEKTKCNTKECNNVRKQMVENIRNELKELDRYKLKKKIIVRIWTYASLEAKNQKFNKWLLSQRGKNEEMILRKMLGKDVNRVIFQHYNSIWDNVDLPTYAEKELRGKINTEEWKGKNHKEKLKSLLELLFKGKKTPTINEVFSKYNSFRDLLFKKKFQAVLSEIPDIFRGENGVILLKYLDYNYGSRRNTEIRTKKVAEYRLNRQAIIEALKFNKKYSVEPYDWPLIGGLRKDAMNIYKIHIETRDGKKGVEIKVRFKPWTDKVEEISFFSVEDQEELLLPFTDLNRLVKWANDEKNLNTYTKK